MGSVRGRIFTATGSPNGLMRSVRRLLRVIFKQNASESINIAVLRSGRLYSNRCACNLWSSHSRQEEQFFLADNPKTATVADLFRRAQDLRNENAQASYKEIAAQLMRECSGTPFPPTYNLTIPEQDARAPEEDWSAGLPLVLRGIQQKDWNDIAQGIVLSLEQTENYERERGPEGDHDKWHDRSTGIKGATDKGVAKWMPEELMKLAEKEVQNRSR